MKTALGEKAALVIDTNTHNERDIALALGAGGFAGLQEHRDLCTTVLDLSGERFPVERADVAAVCAELVMAGIAFSVDGVA